jgi:hypothetical protein
VIPEIQPGFALFVPFESLQRHRITLSLAISVTTLETLSNTFKPHPTNGLELFHQPLLDFALNVHPVT